MVVLIKLVIMVHYSSEGSETVEMVGIAWRGNVTTWLLPLLLAVHGEEGTALEMQLPNSICTVCHMSFPSVDFLHEKDIGGL